MFSTGGSAECLWQTPLAFVSGCHRFDPHRHHQKKQGLARRALPQLAAEELTSGHVAVSCKWNLTIIQLLCRYGTLYYRSWAVVVSFSLRLGISVGKQRWLSRFLIWPDLEAQVMIGVITESRKQTLKALFYVACCFLSFRGKESSLRFHIGDRVQ